jgi:hypothetical protein
MSTAQRIKDLIQLLMRGTRAGSLKWQPTADEDSLRLSFPAGNIRLTRSLAYCAEEPEPYVSRSLLILNDKVRVIEEYSPSGSRDNEEFDELFTLARRSAYDTDEVLERLMGEIESQVQK